MIVYLARDIPAFVMYCVNGESGSSILIVSTDSMIESTDSTICRYIIITENFVTWHTYGIGNTLGLVMFACKNFLIGVISLYTGVILVISI